MAQINVPRLFHQIIVYLLQNFIRGRIWNKHLNKSMVILSSGKISPCTSYSLNQIFVSAFSDLTRFNCTQTGFFFNIDHKLN